MTRRSSAAFLSRRNVIVWLSCLVLVSAVLVATRFTSDDPDSQLYAAISARLSEGPASRWIAPEWWGQWNSEGLFLEHPAAVFLLPAALGAMGLPGTQAAYIVGISTGLASLILIGYLVSRMTSGAEGRMTIVLLQFMPIAFIFRIRANHEYPMLLCLLLVLVGLDGVRRSWGWVWLVALALAFALLVKGVFVIIILLAAAIWILTNPTGGPGGVRRPIAACVLGVLAMVAVALAYDAWYVRVTGETFWAGYWRRQLGPLTISTPMDGSATILHNFLFYLLRMLWHPAPWSLAIIVVAWRWGRTVPDRLHAAPEGARRGVWFALTFALAALALLCPASRFAERYVFSANYALGAAGAVIAYRASPRLRQMLEWLDGRIPALPALTWLGLMLLRLAAGPWLPRINFN